MKWAQLPQRIVKFKLDYNELLGAVLRPPDVANTSCSEKKIYIKKVLLF